MKLKIFISFMVLALITLLVGGNTIAYFTDTAKEELIHFVAGTVEIEFLGAHSVNPDDPYVEKRIVSWSIKNTGTNEVFLRAIVIIPDDTKVDENVEFNVTDSNWGKDNDGYYYYNNSVSANETAVFSLEVDFSMVNDPTTLPIDLEVEAIQASNDARELHWH